MGETLCTVAAMEAKAARVPLIGALAGTQAVRAADNPYVRNIRPGYEKNVQR